LRVSWQRRERHRQQLRAAAHAMEVVAEGAQPPAWPSTAAQAGAGAPSSPPQLLQLLEGEHVHVPARSGRESEHAWLRSMGTHMRPNWGIGSGNARGTQLAQEDFRRATFVCDAPGCCALIDLHWARRRAGQRLPRVGDGCTACGSGRARTQNLDGQRRMARDLERGSRRLVYRLQHLVVRSAEARNEAVRAARAQADAIERARRR
jgi:hypothetical protein